MLKIQEGRLENQEALNRAMVKYGAALRRQTIIGTRPVSLSDLLTPQRVLQVGIRELEPQFLCILATQLLHLALQKQVEVQPQLLLLLERIETNLHAACP